MAATSTTPQFYIAECGDCRWQEVHSQPTSASDAAVTHALSKNHITRYDPSGFTADQVVERWLSGYGACDVHHDYDDDCAACRANRQAATPAAPEARTFGDLTDDEVRDAVLTERLDWEAEQEAATPAAPEALRDVASEAVGYLEVMGQEPDHPSAKLLAERLRAALAEPAAPEPAGWATPADALAGWDQPVEGVDPTSNAPRCHECGDRFAPDDAQAEVVVSWSWVRRNAGGDAVMLDDIPEDTVRSSHLVHADPCYLANQDKYELA